MSLKKYVFPLLIAFTSCAGVGDKATRDIVVQVGDNMLTYDQLEEVTPKGLNTEDSLKFVDKYVKTWVKNKLLYDVALRNIGSHDIINKQVEDYRHRLVVNAYLQSLMYEKVQSNVTDEEMRTFYEEHNDMFILKTPIIEGFSLKIPSDAPGLGDVKKWMKKIDESTLEKIEKYSLQNALVYEYFYDRWIDFDEVLKSIPYEVSDLNAFLSKNKSLEVTHEGFWYFLYIKDYVKAGDEEPYEYAQRQIESLLNNEKKQSFIDQIEDDLYQNGLDNGKIIFYENEIAD